MAAETFYGVTVNKRIRGVGDRDLVHVTVLLPDAYDDDNGATFSAAQIRDTLNLPGVALIQPNNNENRADNANAIYSFAYDSGENSIRAYVYDTEDEAADNADLHAIAVDALVWGTGLSDR